MLNWLNRKRKKLPANSGTQMYMTAIDIIGLCKLVDDRALIHIIHKVIESRLMSQEDFMIMRLRLDMLYDRRFDKSVQDHIGPV